MQETESDGAYSLLLLPSLGGRGSWTDAGARRQELLLVGSEARAASYAMRSERQVHLRRLWQWNAVATVLEQRILSLVNGSLDHGRLRPPADARRRSPL